jgi:hypothetical protein
VPDAEIDNDVVNQRARRTADRKRIQIEGLSQETGFLGVKKVATRVQTGGGRIDEEAIELAIARGDVNAVLLVLYRGVIGSVVEEMLAIGQEEGPAMGGVEFGVDGGDGAGGAPIGRDLEDGVARGRSEQDDAAGTPGATPGRRGVAQDANDGGVEVERFDLEVGEEPDTGTIGGPEGIDAAVSAGEDTVCAGAERVQVEFATSAEDERSAVRRESGLLSEVAFDFEGGAKGRDDGRIQWESRVYLIGPQQEKCCSGEKREGSNGPGYQLAAATAVNGESGDRRRGRIGGGD